MSLSTGDIEEIYLKTGQGHDRRVQIYKPFKQPISQKTKYLIMNDGEELFDESDSWNGRAWDIDGKFLEYKNSGNSMDIIIIAIDNAKRAKGNFIDDTRRYIEYFPKESIDYFEDGIHKFIYKSFVDKDETNHPLFIVNTLIPALEKKFDVSLDSSNLGIMGASMGALSALNTAMEYPELFGFVGCISTHWIGIKPSEYLLLPFNGLLNRKPIIADEVTIEAIIKYSAINASNLKDKKVYFDYGTEGLDYFYPEPQARINKIFDSYQIEYMFKTNEGQGHEPKYFGSRFIDALQYLIN